MPVLPISDGQGNFLPTAIAALSAVMSSPRIIDPSDEAKRETFARAAELLPPNFPILVPAGLLATLRDRPPGGMRIPDGAMYAMLILYVNLTCSRHHPSLVGAQRAGSLLPRVSRSTALRAWREFAPVSHFWLAISFRKPQPGKEDWRVYLAEYLGCAEALRLEAESVFAHGQRSPLIDPARSWKCPNDLALPMVRADLEPLTKGELRSLKAYRAPRSTY